MRLQEVRRKRQAGTTLVELVVSVAIIGFAVALIVGAFSSGLLQATIAKRNTASTTVLQYEMASISGGGFNPAAQSHSDCFATEAQASLPTPASAFQGSCPDSTYTLRADVTVSAGPNGSQQWTVAIVAWPDLAPLGSSVSVIKVNR